MQSNSRLFPAIERFFSSNRWPIAFLVAGSLLSYGFELFNFNISIDEESAGVARAQLFWIRMGRWGTYLVNRLITPYTTIPVLPLAFSLILWSISLVVIFRLIEKNSGYGIYLFPALALHFPSLPYILMFSLNAPSVGVGILSTAIGMTLFTHDRYTKKIYSIPFFAFSIGVYQSFLLVIASIMLLVLIDKTILSSPKDGYGKLDLTLVSRGALLSVFWLVLSLVVYWIIANIFLLVSREHLEYVTNFVRLTPLLDQPLHVFQQSALEFLSIYGGHRGIYIGQVFLLPILLSLSIYALLGHRSAGRPYTSIIWLLALILAALLIPFAFHFLNRGHMPVRSMLAVPLVVTIILWMGYSYATSQLIKRIVVIGGILLIVQFSIINNRHFNSTGIALDRDKRVAASILLAMERTALQHDTPSCVEFVGYASHPPNEFWVRSEVFGASFFGWDRGRPNRMLGFLRLMGLGTALPLCSPERRRDVFSHASAMPAWPSVGGVGFYNAVLIVKFSEYSAVQLRAICGTPKYQECVSRLKSPVRESNRK